ncbi:MAG: hypothetical protein GXY44_05130, partial [Phycisphaerales bacterium]|nr:hypothetical protein [Phycisphaerales bacterium]
MTSARTPLVWILLSLTIIPVLNCVPGDTPGDIPPTDEQEPNGSLDNATPVQWDSLGRALLRGRISVGPQVDEADYFALGPLQAGDRLVLEVRTQQTDLDTILGVFDADGKLFALNRADPARPGSLDPSIDQIVRHDSEVYYAVITRAAFSPRVEGDYEIDVRVVGGQAVPVAQGQTVLLDFGAARINIPGVGPVRIDAFD